MQALQEVKEVIEDGKEILDNTREIIEERKDLVEELFEKGGDYIQTNLQLIKLKATDKVAGIVSNLAAQMAVIFLGFFFMLMLNIGIAFWIGEAVGKVYYGFMIVAGFYLLMTIFLMIFKSELIKKPIINSIISQVLK